MRRRAVIGSAVVCVAAVAVAAGGWAATGGTRAFAGKTNKGTSVELYLDGTKLTGTVHYRLPCVNRAGKKFPAPYVGGSNLDVGPGGRAPRFVRGTISAHRLQRFPTGDRAETWFTARLAGDAITGTFRTLQQPSPVAWAKGEVRCDSGKLTFRAVSR